MMPWEEGVCSTVGCRAEATHIVKFGGQVDLDVEYCREHADRQEEWDERVEQVTEVSP